MHKYQTFNYYPQLIKTLYNKGRSVRLRTETVAALSIILDQKATQITEADLFKIISYFSSNPKGFLIQVRNNLLKAKLLIKGSDEYYKINYDPINDLAN